MSISLRISPEKEYMIQKAIEKKQMTKTAFILDAVDEKLGLKKNYKQKIRDLAGWMSHTEADELREYVEIFNKTDDKDWE
ncbi:MAG: DUF1778 domain-containing protein [Desulfobacteraceae bacterium]|nr:DUF1778 domain-containing protein [Desulfobacteraceae bacterium]